MDIERWRVGKSQEWLERRDTRFGRVGGKGAVHVPAVGLRFPVGPCSESVHRSLGHRRQGLAWRKRRHQTSLDGRYEGLEMDDEDAVLR